MLAVKRSAGVASEVNLRECEKCMPPTSMNKAAHSGFDTQRRHHQKSKTGVSVAPQKGLMSSKNLKQKTKKLLSQYFEISLNINVTGPPGALTFNRDQRSH